MSDQLAARRLPRVGAARLAIALIVTALTAAGCARGPAGTAADLGLTTAAVVAPAGQDPTAAVDPATGTIHVVWAHRDAAAHGDGGHGHHGGEGAADTPLSVYLASSTDGGKTFSAPTRVSPEGQDVTSHSGGPPQVAVGSKGELYLAWEQDEPYPGLQYGRSDVLFTRSLDGGRTFEPPRTAVRNEGVVSTSFFDLFVADGGRVWVGFLDYRSEIGADGYRPTQVRTVHSDDGGVSFSPSVEVDELACECCRVEFATQGGDLLLGWRQIYPRGPYPGPLDPVRDVVVARSANRGATWSPPSPLHADNWLVNQCPHSGPALQSDSRGTLHAAWYTGAAERPGVYYADAARGQPALGEPRALYEGTARPAPVPSLAVDDADRTWITWETATEDGPRSAQVHAARVVPDGTLQVAPEPLGTGEVPRVAAGGQRVVLVWAAPDGIRALAGEIGTGNQR